MRAPTGTVAILFTDVAASSAGWERLGEAFRAALDRHDALLRAAFAAEEGYEVKTEGDSFMVAFQDAGRAARAAWSAQRAIGQAQIEGADGPLCVRMGLHLGPAITRPDPVTGRMDYFGPTVNKAARIAGAANPGQVLLADEARVGVDLPTLDLGLFPLRGLTGLHRIWQLGAEHLGAPRIPTERRSNLPERLDPVFGREEHLARLQEAIQQGQRCLTLRGPAGVGKSHLAHELARQSLDAPFQRITWCALSGARDVSSALAAVARALELPLGREPEEQLALALASRGRLLLLLDDAEAAVDPAAGLIARWLDCAPQLTVLTTSRRPLGLRGERLFEVEPLSTEHAVALFRSRAPSASDHADVAALVERLDHLPLAIELAAARARTMSPRQILDRLNQRFRLLSGGPADRAARHGSLRAALDWSTDLLQPEEQAALTRLCAFEGGFSLEDAEVVLDSDGWAPDLVQRLVEHSLLRYEPERGRYSASQTVIAYAAERDPAGRLDAERRHGQHLARLGRVGQPTALVELSGLTPRERAHVELSNLRAAARRAIHRGDAEIATPTALAAATLMEQTGPFQEAGQLLDQVLAMSATSSRGDLHACRALIALYAGELDRIQREVEAAIDAAAGDARVEAFALNTLGLHLLDQGRLDEAADAARRSSDLRAARGDRRGQARSMLLVGQVQHRSGHLDKAEDSLTRALLLARAVGDTHAENLILGTRAVISMERDGGARAEASLREVIRIAAVSFDRRVEGTQYGNLGNLLHNLGRLEEAAEAMQRALDLLREVGHTRYVATMLGNMGNLRAALGQHDEALGLLRASVDAHRAQGRRLSLATNLVSLGHTLNAIGAHEEALSALREALALGEDTQNLRVMGAAWQRVAAVYLGLGDLNAAAEALDRADPLLLQAGDQLERGHSLLVRAELHLARGEATTARAAVEQAAGLAEITGVGPRSELGSDLARVRRAVDLFNLQSSIIKDSAR